MPRYATIAVVGGLGTLGTFHVYRGISGPSSEGFLQEMEDLSLMPDFMQWMVTHGRSYTSPVEFQERFKIFSENVKLFKDFDVARDALRNINSPVSEHEVAFNQFMDWSEEEYQAMLGFRPDTVKPQTNVELLEPSTLPDTINWVTEGKVTAVKDQGSCGSCWSFSTTGSIESAYWIKNGSEILLSEQQLVDCSIDYGNNGCGGGLVEYAYHYAAEVPLETESQYPYKAKDQKCAQESLPGDVKLTSFKEVQRFSPEQLAQALTLGPVSVGVDASGFAFKFYNKGIISRFCGTSIDHAVLLVGYGTEKGTDYWLVKNSWSKTWGEDGYFRVKRDMNKQDEGICGIQQTPSYPIV